MEEENSDVEIVPPPGIPSSSSPHATHTMHTSTLSSNVIDLSSEPEEPPSPGNQASQDADGSFEQREEASLEPDFGIVQNHIIGQALAMPPTDDPVPPSSFPTTMASTQPDGQGSSMPVGTPAHDARRLSSESDSYPGEDDYEVDIEDESSYYDESSYDDEVSDSDMEAEDFDLEDEDEEEYTHEVRPDMKQPPSGVEPHERDASENASSDGMP